MEAGDPSANYVQIFATALKHPDKCCSCGNEWLIERPWVHHFLENEFQLPRWASERVPTAKMGFRTIMGESTNRTIMGESTIISILTSIKFYSFSYAEELSYWKLFSSSHTLQRTKLSRVCWETSVTRLQSINWSPRMHCKGRLYTG